MTVSGSAGSYTITFSGGTVADKNVGDITADNSQLTGVFNDASLTDPASFSVSLTNQSAALVAITQDGTASVSVATLADGGVGLGVNTTTTGSGSANEVQTVLVRASAGTFTLTFGGQTTGSLAWNISAAALQTALGGLSSIGSGNVAVNQSPTVGGTLSTITFQGTLANANEQQIVPSAVSGLTSRNELQQLTVTGAASGSYKLAWDSNSNGTFEPGEITAPIAYNASAADIQTALTATAIGTGNVQVASIDATHFSIMFQGSLGGTNVKPVTVNDTSALVAQNEIQQVNLLYADGGTFTLTSDLGSTTKTTAPIAWNAAPGDVQSALNALSNVSAGGGRVSVTGCAGNDTTPFDGGPLAGHHADKFVADAGALENSASFASFNVSGFTSTGSGCSPGNTCAMALVEQLQAAIDTAAINGGLTPGFLTQLITNSTFSATHTVFNGGTAPNDQAYELDIPVALSGSGSTGSFAINATGGNFTVTLMNSGHTMSATSPSIPVGSAAALVQSSLQALFSLVGWTGTVSVTLTGNTYGIQFSATGSPPSIGDLTAAIVLTGSAATTGKNPTDFASTLQSSLRSTLSAAGISYQPTATVASNELQINSGSASFSFSLVFPSPVVAQAGNSSISLTSPQVQYTFDPHQPVVTLNRHVDVSLNYTNSAFQQLGLSSSPVRLDYTGVTLTPIEFNLFLNESEIPVFISGSDLASVSSIDDLISVLQSKINSAISNAFDGGATGLPSTGGLTAANYTVTVCRPNINPSGEKCDHIGNRIEFDVITDAATRTTLSLPDNKVTSLSMDVPLYLPDGTLNGAVTELGFPAVTGATQRGKAGTFFLNNVSLTGEVEVAIQNVSLTANIGFLGITATAQGTQGPNHLLLDLSASIALKNPTVTSSSTDANLLDLSVLVAAITNGKFLYDSNLAGNGGSDTSPPTGFFTGTLSGGFGVLLTLAPSGFLSGLSDLLNAQLSISAWSTDWFQHLPTPDVHFQGPDFQSILSKFQSLDFSSIAQALQLVINLVKGLEQPGTAIGDVLDAKLPLINQSLSQIIDVVSSVTNKIQAAITSPASAIQQLNYILSNAFGLPTPSVSVQETTKGDGTHAEAESVDVTADNGTFTLTFLPNGGSPETTGPIAYNADPSLVQTALNKLDGVDVSVGGSAEHYTITFNHDGARAPFSSDPTQLARGPPLLTWNNGEVDFTFDLGTSVQLTRPFDLDLSQLTSSLPSALASIANALIGAGGSGTLTLNAGATLHVALGLDLSSALTVNTTTQGVQGTTSEVDTAKINAPGGTFKLSYAAPTAPPDNVAAAASTGGTLAANTYFHGSRRYASERRSVFHLDRGHRDLPLDQQYDHTQWSSDLAGTQLQDLPRHVGRQRDGLLHLDRDDLRG